tara:strand:+ start:105 stop:269 length:165 start_codon:yes stop_codon:yes gene_type:complete
MHEFLIIKSSFLFRSEINKKIAKPLIKGPKCNVPVLPKIKAFRVIVIINIPTVK